MPDWARAPLDRWGDYVDAELKLLELASTSIAVMQGYGELAAALAEFDEFRGRPPRETDRARTLSDLASTEVSEGFPLLHAHSTVALWNALEVAIEDLAVAWMLNVPGAMAAGSLGRVRIQVSDFESLGREDLARTILQRIETEAASGVTRFERVLDEFGISGPIRSDVRQIVFELQQVRNVIVHRQGIADTRFVEACPWFDAVPGTPIRITSADHQVYFFATCVYVFTILNRLNDHFGSPTKDLAELFERLDEALKRRQPREDGEA